MRRLMRIGLVLLGLASAPARADVVVERWGVAGHVQHAGTLAYRAAGAKGTLMTFDLSAMPKGTRVYRARLVFRREGMYGEGFEIVPAEQEDRKSVV